MIEDIAIDFLNKKEKTDEALIPLSEIEKWINSGDFLKYFKNWRQMMWKNLLKSRDFKNKDAIWKETALKSPNMYGLKYSDYKRLKPSPQAHPNRKVDL